MSEGEDEGGTVQGGKGRKALLSAGLPLLGVLDNSYQGLRDRRRQQGNNNCVGRFVARVLCAQGRRQRKEEEEEKH